MVAALALLKPFLYLWLGLKALDDVSLFLRVSRLVAVALPGNTEDSAAMCDLCDDVVADLLAQGGLAVIPCRLVCLRVPKCIRMCEAVKEISSTSTKYPCAAAGYCDAEAEHLAESDIECSIGRFFSCNPKKYCHRERTKFLQFSCVLKPGFGRWVGLQNSFAQHSYDLASGLLRQPHCGEPDAGPYCIAKPTGFGALCEVIGAVLSILYGGYQSVLAIESVGGDDDQQWLIFWVVQAAVLSLERFFMRPILSTVPMYYEFKLLFLIWLMSFNGASRAYRRFRRFLIANTNLISNRPNAVGRDWKILEDTGKELVRKRLEEIQKDFSNRRLRSNVAVLSSQQGDRSLMSTIDMEIEEEHTILEEDAFSDRPSSTDSLATSVRKMQLISDYILSPKGSQELMSSRALTKTDRDKMFAIANAQLKFEPRYLYIQLLGVLKSIEGELPPMDVNGLADPYVTCRLVQRPKKTKAAHLSPLVQVPRESDDVTSLHSDHGIEEVEAIPPNSNRFRILVHEKFQFARAIVNRLARHLHKTAIEHHMVSSKILYRTKRPRWNQLLELPLNGRIDESGTYHNDNVRDLSLRLEVWDADVEFWGYVLHFSPVIMSALAILTVLGYISGFLDHLPNYQITVIKSIYFSMLAILLISYVMVEVNQADDDPIGFATVPLQLLMDKGEHALRLKLREMDASRLQKSSLAGFMGNASFSSLSWGIKEKTVLEEKIEESGDEDKSSSENGRTPRNLVGGYGILQVKLTLSES